MTKTIAVSLPEELFLKIRHSRESIKISRICQTALEFELMEKETLTKARELGIKDGDKAKSILTDFSRKEIESAFEKFSQNWNSDKLYELADELQLSLSIEDLNMLQPKFEQIFNGELILSDWMKYESGKTAQDKWSEVAWAYVEGTYLGLTSKDISKQASSVKESQEITAEIKRIQRRVPRWFKNPTQINSRILIEFLTLSDRGNKQVNISDLKAKCNIKEFDINFAQMKNFGKRNHGKVFDTINGKVELWLPVKDFVQNEYNKHKN